MTPQDSPEARIARYDLVTNYRCGASIEEMERNDESGEWVRWEDVESRLHEQVQEIERLMVAQRVWDELSMRVSCSSPDGSAELEQVQYAYERAEAAESALTTARSALVKVRAHTSYVNPSMELLSGLLTSIERIVDAGLAELTQGHASPYQAKD